MILERRPNPCLVVLAVLVGFNCAADERHSARLQPRPLPEGAHGHRAHRLGDRLFVFGGFGPAAISLDEKTGEWTKFAPMKVAKTFFGSAVVNGRIHAIGGVGRLDEPAVIERFDQSEDRWEVVLRSEKLPKTHFSAAAVGDKVYVVGGFPDEHSGVHVFDVRTGELDAVSPMPGHHRGDHFHYVVGLQGRLHVLGGMRFTDGESGPMSAHWMFDGEEWHEREALPQPSISKLSAYGVIGGKLYVFDKLSGLHHVYDPKTDRWSNGLTPLPAVLVLPAIVVENDRMHVLGGLDPTTRTASTAVHTYDAKSNRWHAVK